VVVHEETEENARIGPSLRKNAHKGASLRQSGEGNENQIVTEKESVSAHYPGAKGTVQREVAAMRSTVEKIRVVIDEMMYRGTDFPKTRMKTNSFASRLFLFRLPKRLYPRRPTSGLHREVSVLSLRLCMKSGRSLWVEPNRPIREWGGKLLSDTGRCRVSTNSFPD